MSKNWYVLPVWKCMKYMLTCMLACTAISGYAQTLSLQDAINRTIANYPQIKQRQAEVAEGKAHISTVNGNRLPSLKLMDEVTAGTSNSLPGAYFSLGTIPSNSGSIRATDNGTAASGNFAVSYLDWSIYTFGYYNAQKKEAVASLATNQAMLNSDTYLLTGDVINLYLDWLKKYRLLQIEAENLNRAAVILNAIKANVRSGLKPGVDSSTANADYSRNRLGYLQAANDYEYDKIALSAYAAADTNIAPDTAILSQALGQHFDMPLNPDSVSNNPLLDVYQKDYEQQLAANKTISHSYLPKLSLEGAGWMRGSSISPSDAYDGNLANGLSYSRYNYLFGLTLSYNLFDLKHMHDRKVEGNYLAKAKQEKLETQSVQLNKQLQQANAAYAGTQEKLKEIQVELASARQAYTQQVALYKAGLNTLIEVTNALYVLKQTETDNVQMQNELLQELFIKASLSNQLFNFIAQLKS